MRSSTSAGSFTWRHLALEPPQRVRAPRPCGRVRSTRLPGPAGPVGRCTVFAERRTDKELIVGSLGSLAPSPTPADDRARCRRPRRTQNPNRWVSDRPPPSRGPGRCSPPMRRTSCRERSMTTTGARGPGSASLQPAQLTKRDPCHRAGVATPTWSSWTTTASAWMSATARIPRSDRSRRPARSRLHLDRSNVTAGALRPLHPAAGPWRLGRRGRFELGKVLLALKTVVERQEPAGVPRDPCRVTGLPASGSLVSPNPPFCLSRREQGSGSVTSADRLRVQVTRRTRP